MKNIIIILILGSLAFYFWPQSEYKNQVKEEYNEEEFEDEEEFEEPKTQPKPQKLAKPLVIKKPAPSPKKSPKTNKIAIQPANNPIQNEWFKSTEPPKDIVFKVDKKGNAIAFGDIYLGRVGNSVNGFAKTKVKPVKLWDTTDIPYHIDQGIPSSQKDVILATLNYFNENTNLNFIPNDGSQPDSIVFLKGDEHCYSYLGKVGGHQPIYLSKNCYENEIAHELMHAIGFIHEHTRTDRNDYVDIKWDNIQKGFENQFALAPRAFMADTLTGFPFSFHTRMLYDPKSFAKDKSKVTLSSKTDKRILPVGSILSPDDISRINNTY